MEREERVLEACSSREVGSVGEIGHLKPLVDHLAALRPDLLPGVAAIIWNIVRLTEEVTPEPESKPQRKINRSRQSPSAALERGRR